jgi:squalene-hopene/tetraprenyl-beta-curcumene cyclase
MICLKPGFMFIIFAACLAAAPTSAPLSPADQGDAVVGKAMHFFMAQQRPDGSFKMSDREPPALTGMVLRAMALDPAVGAKTPEAKKAIAFLLATQQPDGGIYEEMLGNYSTALCISGLAAANDPTLKESIAKAVAYLKGGQWTDTIAAGRGEKVDPNSPLFGGWNYGGAGRRAGRADLSNTAQVLGALKDAGLSKGDPAYQNALKFASRLQNNSETNPAKWASNDGGFIYNPGQNGNGESAAGSFKDADGKPMVRSYGSMTYAGLETMLYAGLSKDDPRVKAALTWIRGNWTLDEHPGMQARGDAQAGVFYYYNVFARSMAAYGEPIITDKQGTPHDWRKELIAKLASIQKPDGSFEGTNQWMENDPMIATCLATAALQEALQDLKANPNPK